MYIHNTFMHTYAKQHNHSEAVLPGTGVLQLLPAHGTLDPWSHYIGAFNNSHRALGFL